MNLRPGYVFTKLINKKGFFYITPPERDDKQLMKGEKSKKKKSEMTNRFVEKLTIIFNELHFAQNENKITLTHDFESYLDKDLYKELKPYLKGNSMDFVWDNNIFNPQNTYWK